jgi:DNA-binding LacI/PurR family transcriptional regulator
LAKQYDISYITARNAIAKLEAMGYLISRHGSGTYVADPKEVQAKWERMKTEKKTVALLLDTKVHHYGTFYDRLVSLLQLGGYKTSIFTWQTGWGDEEMMPVLNELQESPPHSIVIQQIRSGTYDGRINAIAKKAGTRVISSFLPSTPRPANWCKVHCSRHKAAVLAGRYLVEQGHQRIGLITHERFVDPDFLPNARKRFCTHTDLILGLGHELRQHEMRHAMSIYYLKRIDEINGANPTHPDNMDLMASWLESPNCPTAFVGEDFRVASLLRVAQQRKIKLSKNFQVVGLGNTPWSALMNIPSVWFREDIAAEHVVNLIKMDDHLFKGVNHQIEIEPELVLREQF